MYTKFGDIATAPTDWVYLSPRKPDGNWSMSPCYTHNPSRKVVIQSHSWLHGKKGLYKKVECANCGKVWNIYDFDEVEKVVYDRPKTPLAPTTGEDMFSSHVIEHIDGYVGVVYATLDRDSTTKKIVWQGDPTPPSGTIDPATNQDESWIAAKNEAKEKIAEVVKGLFT